MKPFKTRKLNLSPLGTPTPVKASEDLQRTEEWLKARSGNFTGSKIKDLMSCGRSSAKMTWIDANKVYDFGAAAEKYVYEVGKERLSGDRSQHITSKQMNHGIESEPLFIAKLLSDKIIESHKDLPYTPHGEIPHLGASPDGEVVFLGEKMVAEMKCCVSWAGHYKRKYERVHEKHDDFWQHQTEMLVTGTTKLFYAVANPMTVERYETEIVEASEIHQKAIMTRVKIANNAISRWGGVHNYAECLSLAIAEFKETE